jgi:hypothetical protein
LALAGLFLPSAGQAPAKDVMDKIEEYRAHAAPCLSLARKCSSHDEKKQLESLADVWRVLADYREAAFERE